MSAITDISSMTDQEIIEALLGMAYEKAIEIYSKPLVEGGLNPRHYGSIANPDGYAVVTGT
ncbi:MAG: hypothetical protein M0P57_00615 [Syntrophales bacterium]|nr:hypothetical protein [Syntrophales bacterium]MDY0043689.1 hypothetical protein [Syntrophales bacterium]